MVPDTEVDLGDPLDAAAQSEGGAGWTSHEIHDGALLLRLGPDVASITYRATAVRAGQDPYHALFTSVYVRREGAWKLALHQQTPVPSADDG